MTRRKSAIPSRSDFSTCRVLRRVLVTHYKLNIETGAQREDGKEWRDGPCDTPLFGIRDRTEGVCSACRAGWKTEHNFPIDANGNPL